MRLQTLCAECDINHPLEFVVDVSFKSEPLYEIECPKGHRLKVFIYLHDFQKLFEVAVNALADNYYREAIGSFAASLERFMELFVRVVTRAHGVESAALEGAWKQISKQSERQLGAFVFTYAQAFNDVGPVLPSNLIELRNRVVHQGYFPDEAECFRYGTAVLELARGVISSLHTVDRYRNALIRSLNAATSHPAFAQANTHYFPFPLIGINRPTSDDTKPLADMVAEARHARSQGVPFK